MKFQTTLATALLASVANSASVRRQDAAALAATAGAGQQGQWACGLTQDNLDDLIDGYTSLLTLPNATDFATTASRILASNFTVHSDSLNTLNSLPLGVPAYTAGRAGFVASAATLTAIPTLNTTDVYVGGYWNASSLGNSWWSGNQGQVCDDLKVNWRFSAIGVGSGAYAVGGIMDLVLAPGVTSAGEDAVVIEEVYVEFNTVAWLLNLGVPIAVPAAVPAAKA